MSRALLVAVAAVVLVVGGWAAYCGGRDAPRGAAARSGSPSVAALAAQLEEEAAARRALEAEVEFLGAQVAALAERLPAPPAANKPKPPPAAAKKPPTPAGVPGGRPWFDEQALRSGGFSESEAADLRARFEEIEMERLYLGDRARREGWSGTPRFMQDNQALNARRDALRDRYGDDVYDWMLFASGRQNRALVRGLLQNSPAAEAGIQAGDVVIRYDDQPVFSGQDLRQATGEGRAGETVRVEIERDGKRHFVYVPRGPLGIQFGSARRRPDDLR